MFAHMGLALNRIKYITLIGTLLFPLKCQINQSSIEQKYFRTVHYTVLAPPGVRTVHFETGRKSSKWFLNLSWAWPFYWKTHPSKILFCFCEIGARCANMDEFSSNTVWLTTRKTEIWMSFPGFVDMDNFQYFTGVAFILSRTDYDFSKLETYSSIVRVILKEILVFL